MDNENVLSPDEEIIPPSETEPETPPEPDKKPTEPDDGDNPGCEEPGEGEDEEENAKSCSRSWIYQTIPNFYDRVRNSLNVGSLMDNDTIDFPENAPMAEMRIKKRLPEYESLKGEKRMLFETCIVYMTCYALCPLASSMRITRQKDPSLELEFANSASSEQPCDRFLWMIDDLINQINDEESPSFFGFRVTKGSGCNVIKPCWPYRGRGAYRPL